MKSIDILFIEPPVKALAEGGQSKKKAAGHLPHLGICILAAVAEKKGYTAAIIDAMALQLTYAEILEDLKQKRPRIVGLTAMTHSISSAAKVASLIKEHLPDTTVLLGGVHITAATEATFMKYPGMFDVAVVGEGEDTFAELIDALAADRPLDSISGLAFMRDGKLHRTPPRPIIKDMDRLPMPAWHLLPDMIRYYTPTLISAGGTASNHLLTSRGCPSKCIFCDTSVNGNRVRGYSADYVMEMVDILHNKYKVADIQINDDTFVTLRRRMYDICERLTKKNYGITWSCDARASDVSEEGLKLMRASGCWQIAYGVETGSPRILKLLDKMVTMDDIHNAFRWTKAAGISTKGFFILGHPTETRESLEETVRLMLELELDVVGCTFFTVFPGSPVFKDIQKYGSFDPDWDRTHTYEIGNFIPAGFTAEELVRLRKKALTRFYFRPRYMLRHLASIRSPYDAYRTVKGASKLFIKNVLQS